VRVTAAETTSKNRRERPRAAGGEGGTIGHSRSLSAAAAAHFTCPAQPAKVARATPRPPQKVRAAPLLKGILREAAAAQGRRSHSLLRRASAAAAFISSVCPTHTREREGDQRTHAHIYCRLNSVGAEAAATRTDAQNAWADLYVG
jgi:hypothetical protein